MLLEWDVRAVEKEAREESVACIQSSRYISIHLMRERLAFNGNKKFNSTWKNACCEKNVKVGAWLVQSHATDDVQT